MRIADLPPRQREIVECLLNGHSSNDIAAAFGLSPKSVGSSKALAMEKLGVSSDVELGAYGARDQMVGLIKAAQAVTGSWADGDVDPNAVRNLALELERLVVDGAGVRR